mgnify:CR=1 FL=1
MWSVFRFSLLVNLGDVAHGLKECILRAINKERREKLNRAILKIVIAASLWGFSGVYVKEADNMPSTCFAFFRTVVPALILFTLIKGQKKTIFKGPWKWMLGASTLNALRTVLFFISFNLTSIGNAQVTLYSWPIWATVLSFFFLGEKIGRFQWSLLATAFIGVLIMLSSNGLSFSGNDFQGVACMALSAFIYSVALIIFKKHEGVYSAQETVFFQNIVSPFVFLPFVIYHAPELTVKQIGLASTFGLMNGTIAFFLFFSALRDLKTATASQITYLEPVVGVILAYLIYGEVLGSIQIVGASLILGSTFVLSIYSSRRRLKQAAAGG